jgi:hypothetical protein
MTGAAMRRGAAGLGGGESSDSGPSALRRAVLQPPTGPLWQRRRPRRPCHIRQLWVVTPFARIKPEPCSFFSESKEHVTSHGLAFVS